MFLSPVRVRFVRCHTSCPGLPALCANFSVFFFFFFSSSSGLFSAPGPAGTTKIASKFAHFYTLDTATGELVSSTKPAAINFAGLPRPARCDAECSNLKNHFGSGFMIFRCCRGLWTRP